MPSQSKLTFDEIIDASEDIIRELARADNRSRRALLRKYPIATRALAVLEKHTDDLQKPAKIKAKAEKRKQQSCSTSD